jgi:hypothetical protein
MLRPVENHFGGWGSSRSGDARARLPPSFKEGHIGQMSRKQLTEFASEHVLKQGKFASQRPIVDGRSRYNCFRHTEPPS